MSPADRADGPNKASSTGDSVTAPTDGAYLTDGKTLFHVERTLVDGPRKELFVELEDCATLDLIFCSARSVTDLELRTVKPRIRAAG